MSFSLNRHSPLGQFSKIRQVSIKKTFQTCHYNLGQVQKTFQIGNVLNQDIFTKAIMKNEKKNSSWLDIVKWGKLKIPSKTLLTHGCVFVVNARSYILRRPHNFAKPSPYFWPM